MKQEKIKENAFGERYIPSISGHIFAEQSSANLYDNLLDDSIWSPKTFHVLVGTDSGLLVKHILQRGVPEDSVYVFIELPEFIHDILLLISDMPSNTNIAICSINDWLKTAEKKNLVTYMIKNAFKYHRSISAIEEFLPSYHDLYLNIELALKNKLYEIEATRSYATVVKGQLTNIAENHYPAYLLNQAFPDSTCIILGGGPSLDEHIEWIKLNRDKLIIIAVSRIAKKLIAEDLIPHIIISVDFQEVSFDVSKELLTLPENVLFIHAHQATPQLVGQWHGRSAYLGRRLPWVSPLEKQNIEAIGPTVTNTAINTATALGCTRILLSGIDMCFSNDGNSHTTGGHGAKASITIGKKGEWIQTYNGEKAFSTIELIHAANGLATLVQSYKDYNINIFNLSKNAAEVPLIPFQSIDEVILDNQALAVENIIADIIPARDDLSLMQEYNAFIKNIEQTAKAIEDIKRLSKEAIKYNKSLYQKNGNGFNTKLKSKIDKIQEKLDNKYKDISVVVKGFNIGRFMNFTTIESMETMTNQQLENIGKIYYQAYIKNCEELEYILKDSIKRIYSRAEELKKKPNIEKIIEQWKTDHQLGRAKLWKNHHYKKYNSLDNSKKQTIDELISEFESILENDNTKHQKDLKKGIEKPPLDIIERNIKLFFKQKNNNGLQQVIEGLNQLDNHEQYAHDLYYLANGLLHSLNEEPKCALTELHKIKSGLYHDEIRLQEILNISLKLDEKKSAQEALAGLSYHSATYLHMLAKMFLINNEIENSLSTYNRYLEKFPNDKEAVKELSALYRKRGDIENAKNIDEKMQ